MDELKFDPLRSRIWMFTYRHNCNGQAVKAFRATNRVTLTIFCASKIGRSVNVREQLFRMNEWAVNEHWQEVFGIHVD